VRSQIPKSELDLLPQLPFFAECSRHELREIARPRTPTDGGPGSPSIAINLLLHLSSRVTRAAAALTH